MDDKLTTIAFHTYHRALLLKSQLEAYGVDCFLSGENLIQPAVAGGVRLKVRSSEVEKALRIIEDLKVVSGSNKEKLFSRLQNVRRILVPVDFSEYSLNACYYAIELAAKFKAEVKLFHASFKPAVEVPPTYEGAHFYQINYNKYFEELDIKARRQLIEMRSELKTYVNKHGLSGIKLTYGILHGFAEDAIEEMCMKYRPGIVVIGTHGLGQTSEGFFGSVANRLIERLNVPILAIPASATYKGIGKTRNLLYATDFDETDYEALHKLIFLTRPFELSIHCVHISVGRKKPWDQVKMDSLRSSLHQDYPAQVIECSIMVSDNILNGLETYMRNNSIGLVAFNSHKRTLFTQLFAPSITKQALSRLTRPVFIFRSQ